MDPELIQCPICTTDLPVDAFGVSNGRSSGRNLYCKSCIRQKVADSRRALREFRARQKAIRSADQGPAMMAPGPRSTEARYDENGILFHWELDLRSNPHDERVYGAIYHGARTYKQIMRVTALCKDAVGDALAELFDHPKRIRTEIIDDVRIYRVVEQIRNPQSDIRNSERAA
jgi:hypothetical protein